VPTQLAPDFFRHGRRTAAKLTLSLMHVSADLLLGGLQTGYHARTPSWNMAKAILSRDDFLDLHQTDRLVSLSHKSDDRIALY
jgi:hypothetical protein